MDRDCSEDWLCHRLAERCLWLAARMGHRKLWWLILHTTLWALWGGRNLRIFYRESCAEDAIVDFVWARVKEWFFSSSNVNSGGSSLLGGFWG